MTRQEAETLKPGDKVYGLQLCRAFDTYIPEIQTYTIGETFSFTDEGFWLSDESDAIALSCLYLTEKKAVNSFLKYHGKENTLGGIKRIRKELDKIENLINDEQ